VLVTVRGNCGHQLLSDLKQTADFLCASTPQLLCINLGLCMLLHLCSQSPTLLIFLEVMISVRVFAASYSNRRKDVAFVQRTLVSSKSAGHCMGQEIEHSRQRCWRMASSKLETRTSVSEDGLVSALSRAYLCISTE